VNPCRLETYQMAFSKIFHLGVICRPKKTSTLRTLLRNKYDDDKSLNYKDTVHSALQPKRQGISHL